MLRAMLHGKRRGSGIKDRQAFHGGEDLLTASVFERLGYLGDDFLVGILQALPGFAAASPDLLGELEEITFWPSLQDSNQRRVEPDVLIRFSNLTLLVEAKRHDGVCQHSSDQLDRQKDAAERTSDLGDRPLLQVAIGGHTSTRQSGLASDILCIDWRDLQHACFSALTYGASGCEKRIIADIILAFELHGFKFAKSIEPMTPSDQRLWLFPPLMAPSIQRSEPCRIRSCHIKTTHLEGIS